MIAQENHPHIVGGTFDSADRAAAAVARLNQSAGLPDEQIELVRPGDSELPRKVEPDAGGIFRTLISAHAWFAVLGFLGGIGLALVLVNVGPAFTRANPFYTVLAMGWVGLLATSLLGGLMTLRPDRNRVSVGTRRASRQGQWSVVAHCSDRTQKDAALAQLSQSSLATRQSL